MPKKITKQTRVTRKFLTDLADSIYNTKTRRFLRLCNGTLQNGPDPTNERRPMHCGLGELYFAMTGRQPEDTAVEERDVIDEAVKRSTLDAGGAEKVVEAAAEALRKSGLPEDVRNDLISDLEDRFSRAEDDVDTDTGIHEFTPDAEAKFREVLGNIPGVNDDGCGEDKCTVEDYRARSQRVAKQLRLAAKILPR
jgi:hypothetical protein